MYIILGVVPCIVNVFPVESTATETGEAPAIVVNVELGVSGDVYRLYPFLVIITLNVYSTSIMYLVTRYVIVRY